MVIYCIVFSVSGSCHYQVSNLFNSIPSQIVWEEQFQKPNESILHTYVTRDCFWIM